MALYNKIFLVCFSLVIFHNCQPLYGINALDILKIDNKDSVYLKISEGIISGEFITIPIYIESDDDINSLDFSLNFDVTKLKYEAIIDHTGHIQFTDFFSPIDSTLRFTSNSFTQYNLSKKIISLKFKVLVSANCVVKGDFTKMFSYLNGDLCSSKLPNEQACITAITDHFNYQKLVDVYPNPSSDFLHIVTKHKATVTLTSPTGTSIVFPQDVLALEPYLLDTKFYAPGIYLLTFQMDELTLTKMVVIHH